MRSGRLFRYGELGADQADAALLEREFAALVGRRHCIAVNSGGGALFLALKVLDVCPDEPVLVNAFTLAPVPGAIVHTGARPVIVAIGPDYKIDVADLRRKARDSGARVLMLSHMRGHLADMDAVMAACDDLGLLLVEDCAHALGARWGEQTIGTFGVAAAFSAQTYKHLNAGEGGFLVVDDPDLAARAILHSGSYMLHQQHLDPPSPEIMAHWTERTPNFSLRMTALAAAVLRPQLHDLPERVERWNTIYRRIAAGLARAQAVRLPLRPPQEHFTATSIQFSLPGLSPQEIMAVLDLARARGLPIKWFGAAEQAGFTSAPRHWRYAPGQSGLDDSHRILGTLCDIRTPVSLTDEECDLIADIVRESLEAVACGSTAAERHDTAPVRSGSRHQHPGGT
ncbi:DegT/DnrJ/EryC1/StrS aminotransferase family protein [Phreatobacter aquaticus]|uniref:DegT/DnrJ/EryC1/StrS aminotransferase family protein n=2 Tax=Phreatobacter aquaticus TaxID=2570229 RepID=A0A4D7QQY6_9HYPH|nr:DegT/DnrJ/EryC1/StrS aminotransferase family protein [Phreatobacter aquaticus]